VIQYIIVFLYLQTTNLLRCQTAFLEDRIVYKYFKRLMDIVLSGVGLIVLIPVFLLAMIAIKIDSPGPVFFKQKRFKKDKEFFYILKFRTMRSDAPRDVPTHLLTDAANYITRVGRVLRFTSIDEIPQLLNIFVGDMSVVGPRPALYNQLDLMQERDKYGANEVKPGLTGWAQINGRDGLSIDVKAKFDGEYTEKLNRGGFAAFSMDCKCFVGTINRVLNRDEIKEGSTSDKN